MARTGKGAYTMTQIYKLSKDFGGKLTDAELMEVIGVAKNTFYKYKRQLQEQLLDNLKDKLILTDINELFQKDS